MSRLPRSDRALGLVWIVITLTGCHYPAHMVWSPDGTRAGYRIGKCAGVIDRKGEVVSDLGPSWGGFAWSADSSTLYFTSPADPDAPPRDVERGWIDPAVVAAAATRPAPVRGGGIWPWILGASKPVDRSVYRGQINGWRKGEVKPVTRVPVLPFHCCLSPDGEWLVIGGLTLSDDGHNDLVLHVYAYCFRSDRLYVVSECSGLAVCFTGRNRLAYLAAGRDEQGKPTMGGSLVEIDLRDAPDRPERRRLDIAGIGAVAWMQPGPGGDLLIGGTPDREPADSSRFNLVRYSRRDGSVKTLAEEIGLLFTVSPGGDKVLFESVVPANADGPEKHALAVVNTDGTGRRELRDLRLQRWFKSTNEMAMWPAWLDNDRFYFGAPTATAAPKGFPLDRVYYDIVLYRLGADGMTPVETLTDKHSQELRPAIEHREFR